MTLEPAWEKEVMKSSLCLFSVLAFILYPGPRHSLAAPQNKNDGWKPARALKKSTGQEFVRTRILPGDASEILLEYAMPQLKTVKAKKKIKAAKGKSPDAEEITELILGNAPRIGNPGKPVLPVVPCTIALPEGRALDSVDVVSGNPTLLPGKHRIRHGQKPAPLVANAKTEYTPPDPAVYNSDEPWPRKTFSIIGVQKKRGVSILVVNLNPVMYHPKSGQVSYFPSISLKVKTRPAPAEPAGKAQRHRVKYRPDRVRPLSLQVDNPGALNTYREER